MKRELAVTTLNVGLIVGGIVGLSWRHEASPHWSDATDAFH